MVMVDGNKLRVGGGWGGVRFGDMVVFRTQGQRGKKGNRMWLVALICNDIGVECLQRMAYFKRCGKEGRMHYTTTTTTL